MKTLLHNITCLAVTFAAINWGLVGLFDVNLVHTLFGMMPMIEKYVYIGIGVAGLIFAALETGRHNYF